MWTMRSMTVVRDEAALQEIIPVPRNRSVKTIGVGYELLDALNPYEVASTYDYVVASHIDEFPFVSQLRY